MADDRVIDERIDGRAPGISSPSSHQRGNIIAESNGDLATAIGVLVRRLDDLGADARARAAAIAEAPEASMLFALVDGLDAHSTRLQPR